MKYFIVGLHGSGKHEVLDILKNQGVACGDLFSNMEHPSESVYNSNRYEHYSTEDVNSVFENNAYLFLRELSSDTERFYEGLSKYTYENNDVFVLSPDQLVCIPPMYMPKDACFVWIDNTKSNRYARYRDERSEYDFSDKEKQETRDIDTFIKIIHSEKNNILYFINEDPVRIAAVVFALVQHPDLLSAFTQAFNS